MTALNKKALRGLSVEGSFYLAECGNCGEMYPSNKLTGGEPLFSGDYGECNCPLCGADDSDIADNGAWGSEAVTAWNYQQKRIEALLDELEAVEKRNAELESRTVTVKLPKRTVAEVMLLSGFDRQYAEGWCSANDNAINEMKLAGIQVIEGEQNNG
ncbi:hypothetical protein FI178_01850 [Salmonella enterica subsp. enterica]|nr:hypothetical protein [Salmonella enterica subsp. enterica]